MEARYQSLKGPEQSVTLPPQFAPGMAVRTRAGASTDPRMTVVTVQGNQVGCAWFAAGVLQTAVFPAVALYESRLLTQFVEDRRVIFELDAAGESIGKVWEDPAPVVAPPAFPDEPPLNQVYIPGDPLAGVHHMQDAISAVQKQLNPTTQ